MASIMLVNQKHRSQIYATIFANLTAFAFGIALGWSSPILPRLQLPNTPLHGCEVFSLEEISWIGSIYSIGGMIGTPCFGLTADKFGRKLTIIVAAILQIISWIIIEFSSTAVHLYLARFLVGFGGSGFYVAVPIYVAELSSDKIRGALGAVIIIAINFGIVVGYVINSYVDYYTVPFIVIAILVVFLIGFPFAAESPKHLLMQNKEEEAIEALKYFRGYKNTGDQYSKEFSNEIEILKKCRETNSVGKLTWADFSSKPARKSIFIGAVIMALAVVNGFQAIVSYSETIFNDAGSQLSSEVSTIILGIILMLGSYSSTLFIDRAGRKILMSVSSTGCGVSLLTVGLYSYLKENGRDVESFKWLPLICLSLYMLFGAIGMFTVYFVIISEVLSQKIRGFISTALVLENWMLSFVTVKYFPIMLDLIGMHGCMLIFGVACLGDAAFVVFVLPETKGKSIEVIVAELEGK